MTLTPSSPLPTRPVCVLSRFLWHNENKTFTYDFVCGGENDEWIRSPYAAPVTVKNLFYPYDTVPLENSTWSFNQNDEAPYRGWCVLAPPCSLSAFAARRPGR